MTSKKIKDYFEFRMNSNDVVLPQEELFVYKAQRIENGEYIVYCKNSKKTEPKIHTENSIRRNIEEGYWKVM